MFQVLRQRNFALLWVGGLVSTVGTWALYTALPYFVYAQTGSALATGAVFIAQMVPRVVLAPLAGVAIDRWNRQRTMVVADVARAVILLPLLAVRSDEWFWIVYVVAFGEATLTQFFDPAASAFLPRLVEELSLPAANAMTALTGALTRLVAPVLGGTLLALLGLTSVVLADSSSYLVSAILIFLIRIEPLPKSVPAVAGDVGAPLLHALWRESRVGVQTVLGEPTLRTLFLITGLVLVGYGMITVLLIAFVQEVLRGSALVFGWIAAAQGLGGLVGATGAAWIMKAWSPARIVTAALLATGLLYLLLFNVPLVPVDVALAGVMGLPITSFWITTTVLLQRRTPDASRGRVFGAYGMITSLATLAGMGLAGFGASLLGDVPTLELAAGFYLVGAALALGLLSAAERRASDVVRKAVTG
jgi:MFS family permease